MSKNRNDSTKRDHGRGKGEKQINRSVPCQDSVYQPEKGQDSPPLPPKKNK